MIVVLGDPMVDVWEEYDSLRENPEEPGTAVVYSDGATPSMLPGGALNVLMNLPKDEAWFFSTHPMGEYEAGKFFSQRDLDELHGISTKHRLVVDGRIVMRKDQDIITPPTVTARLLKASLQRASTIIVTDYGKGAIDRMVLAQVLGSPAELIILDLKPRLHELLFTTSAPVRAQRVIAKANEREVKELGGPKRWAESYGGSVRPEGLVMTCGAQGAWVHLLPGGFEKICWPAYSVAHPRSVCGAGDVFTAAMAMALRDGWQLPIAVQTAVNRAADLIRTGARTLCLARP